jgi:hypothetical protein
MKQAENVMSITEDDAPFGVLSADYDRASVREQLNIMFVVPMPLYPVGNGGCCTHMGHDKLLT